MAAPINFISPELLTFLGHVVIMAGIIATYVRVVIQQKEIAELKEGFEACKQNLAKLEQKVNNKIK